MVQIVWTAATEEDLDAILAYISKSSFQYAKTFFDNVYEAIENLKFFPRIGRKVPESDNPEDREMVVQNYRIIYQYEKKQDRVLIKMIVHGSRLLKF